MWINSISQFVINFYHICRILTNQYEFRKSYMSALMRIPMGPMAVWEQCHQNVNCEFRW